MKEQKSYHRYLPQQAVGKQNNRLCAICLRPRSQHMTAGERMRHRAESIDEYRYDSIHGEGRNR